MHLDVLTYRRFYDSPLGHVALRMIRRRLRVMWPDVKGQTILGLGYATPYLGPFRAEADRVIALMPAPQGVAHWPRQGRGLTALAEEDRLPLADASIDRVLMVHAVENTETLRASLRQVWRVLQPSGSLVVIAPNRASLWAQMDNSPFGHGRPFTRSQLETTLAEAMFTPINWDRALCLPPFRWRWSLKYGQATENLGQSLWPRFAGVLLAEATKQVYAAIPSGGARTRVRVLAPEAKGAAARNAERCSAREQQDSSFRGQIVPPAGMTEFSRLARFVEGEGAPDLDLHRLGQRDEISDTAEVDIRRLVPSV